MYKKFSVVLALLLMGFSFVTFAEPVGLPLPFNELGKQANSGKSEADLISKIPSKESVGLPVYPGSNFGSAMTGNGALMSVQMLSKDDPDKVIAWGDVWQGASLAALLFTLGKFLIALYLSHSRTITLFGAASSFVVILVWVYASSQILLLGAAYSYYYAREFGSQSAPVAPAAFPSSPMPELPELAAKKPPKPQSPDRKSEPKSAKRVKKKT